MKETLKKTFLASTGYEAFPLILREVYYGATHTRAISDATGIPLFLVEALIKFAIGCGYIERSAGYIALTEDGKKAVEKKGLV